LRRDIVQRVQFRLLEYADRHGDMSRVSVEAALERAGVAPGEVEDVLMGCANPEGATGWNIASPAGKTPSSMSAMPPSINSAPRPGPAPMSSPSPALKKWIACCSTHSGEA
jgi:hypothetical protein